MKLNISFYRRDTLLVAKELLGKKLVHKINGKILSGVIVETEAYMGIQDKAAHSYGGRKTERTKVMFEAGGVSYIYFIYGLYYCFNVVTAEEGIPQAVLIRALQPVEGIEDMALLRVNKNIKELTKKQIINIANGPAKLCSALKLDKTLNAVNLTSDILYIEDVNYNNFEIVETTRIGIDYAEEAKDYPWRFYIKDNPYISKK
ncbi:DNA-3-methyladenine glycosylase [Clostridium sp. UBA4548]|uniref:DNA-3-methyladenine glycosylase n=1 Tax=Clostridium sp. UBA4548 TaxID=1946361 RepID=UPI0025B7AA06|nr:DNA-3-methyladenine glycosylase [Clostridium sp. UBA4548]